jgi:hypothetical protein
MKGLRDEGIKGLRKLEMFGKFCYSKESQR